MWDAPAFGFNEGGTTDPTKTTCSYMGDPNPTACHNLPAGWPDEHGRYSQTTQKCQVCHDVHAATGSTTLLPRDTVTDTCFACHDGTGGKGVYGTLASRGITPGARHRIDQVSVIPGGDLTTGGSRTVTFKGPGGTLTCVDCHSVHRVNTVTAFLGERRPTAGFVPRTTDKLLKRLPTGATTATAEYGSDWCGGCHQGQLLKNPLHDHPVESTLSTTTPYNYRWIAQLSRPSLGGDPPPTSVVVVSAWGVGQNHSAFLMPYPRAPLQSGHKPICQQCHEDSRNTDQGGVGSLDTTGTIGDATAFIDNLDGVNPSTGNPVFQNFPHETANSRMMIESADVDLCTNCHPLGSLP